MTIATLFREIFLRINALAEQLKNGFSVRRSPEGQPTEPAPQPVGADELTPPVQEMLPTERGEHPLSDAELANIADRIAERLQIRYEAPVPEPSETQHPPAPAEDRPAEPQTQFPPIALPRETVREIAERTAEQLAALRNDSTPHCAEGNRESALDDLSAKLDIILAAVKTNGEQIRKIAEIDGNTIFFS